MKTNMKNTNLRKAFYIIDLLLLGMAVVSVLHTGVFRHRATYFIVDYLLLLRANIVFLLYRRDKSAVWPVKAFTLLFGVCFVSRVSHNATSNTTPQLISTSEKKRY